MRSVLCVYTYLSLGPGACPALLGLPTYLRLGQTYLRFGQAYLRIRQAYLRIKKNVPPQVGRDISLVI